MLKQVEVLCTEANCRQLDKILDDLGKTKTHHKLLTDFSVITSERL